MNGNISCQNCIFWVGVGNTGFGECRRKPPIPDINPKTGDPFTRALFPTTRDSDWCAEFRQRKNVTPSPSPDEETLEI